MDEGFARRRSWFDNDKARFDIAEHQTADFEYKFTCPCCGYPTLPERGDYYICPLCNWEDDNQDDPEADKVWGGPNGPYSLAEARANFSRHLIMYDPEKHNGNRPLEHKIKCEMIQAFDSMVGTRDVQTLELLWAQIRQSSQALSDDLHRWVEEREASLKTKS